MEVGADRLMEKLIQIFVKIFDLGPEEISDAMSVNTVDGWDSLKHLILILAIEEEFGVSLSPEEVEAMISVDLIKAVLNDHEVMV
ncbi:MAG: acyl carrier protein [Candidatus Methylomirabilales bacterium]